MLSKLTAMLALTSCLSSVAYTAKALETYDIQDSAGNAFMQMRIFGVNDVVYGPGGDYDAPSTWNLRQPQTDQVLDAVRYWGEVIKVVPGKNPAIINVGTYDDPGASALSTTAVQQAGSGTLVQAAITNSKMGDLINGAHGFIDVGKMEWAPAPFTPSQLPLTPQVDMTSVLIHEVAHALGVSAETETYPISDEGGNVVGEGIIFTSTLDAWSTHLRDENGKAAAAGQYIWCKSCLAPPEDVDAFDARSDQAYFTGQHVNAVLNGAMAGIRVRTGMDLTHDNDEPVFSHIELTNSLMSHQNYRNYATLMEAELSMLQDIGYTIDRRNFFGYSVYNDGSSLTNDHPFFARNADGTDYVADTFNMATLGLGLHVYGSNNNIYQNADLLSGGAGGGGIRVDGVGNHLTILPDTRVYADGAYGRGVMFAYGKDHTFIQRGDIEALGDHGIAVSFDFGHNALGDKTEYRGSYFIDVDQDVQSQFPDYYTKALEEVSGPLVGTFDLSGRVAGRYAAIYMSESGYVGQINIVQGADIAGDIVSNYAQRNDNGALRITDLAFGLKADGNGRSSGIADPDFRIAYGGSITGNNLSLHINGGNTQLTGNHRLYEVAVAQSAVLSGKGNYQINATQQFRNAGIVNPSELGAAIVIDGNYAQSESGALQLVFDDQKAMSSLIVNGHADLSGTIAFTPVRGWYENGFRITSDKWLDAATVESAFERKVTSLESPTLTATVTENGDSSYTISLSRAANAYAQYGNSANSRAVGGVLDGMTDNPGPGLRNLITALDFSNGDGTAVRTALPQLSAEAYASAVGVLTNDSYVSRSAVNNRLRQAFGGMPTAPVSVMGLAPATQANTTSSTASDTTVLQVVCKDDLTRYAAWGSVFGSWSSQSGGGNAASTGSTLGGFTTGIDAAVYDNWRFGAMAGYSRSTFNIAGRGSSGTSDNYTIGAYAGTEWVASDGVIGLRSGLAYSWHNIDMSRSIAFDDFTDNLSADYGAGTFQAFGELGYKLNINLRSVLEPYASLAYVHVRTDEFSEKGLKGAALAVQSGSTDTIFSTLGMRASTDFSLVSYGTTARVDFGWRHAYADVIPTSNASFAAGLAAFSSTGNSIGRDIALIETGFDVKLGKSTTLGIAYQGQFGSRTMRNGVNTNLRVKF